MRLKLLIVCGFAFLRITTGFANDTIKVTLNLDQTNASGLMVKVSIPNSINGEDDYIFPKSIPGIYEFLNNRNSRSNFFQIGVDSVTVLPAEPGNYYKINCDKSEQLIYNISSTVDKFKGISAEDFYFIKDSIYILNWHHLIGYFKQNIDLPYKIVVIKNQKLWGTGSLCKTTSDGNTDIFYAKNYRELLGSPVLYSKPDTTSFVINETKFIVSCSGTDKLLNADKIKNLLSPSLTEILKHSDCNPKEYSFIYYSENSFVMPGLRALEHPNSTMVYYHSALLDNKILINSSVHEFIHAIYAPLRIRSEVIHNFDFASPTCDTYLWFYEGVTEYLTVKTLLNSGVFSHEEFLNELYLSYKSHQNINFSEVSKHIYQEKKQKIFDNFYTKGSLFAFQLDVEIMRRSNSKTNLFGVMKKLQSTYNPETPFDSKTFIERISSISGVDLYNYINENVHTKSKVDFYNTCNKIGYSTKQEQGTLMWSFMSRKTYIIHNYKKNRMELGLKGSTINKEHNCKTIIITAIDESPLDWFNMHKLTNPESGNELILWANDGKKDIIIKATPKQILRKQTNATWFKNTNYQTDLAKSFWNK